MTKKLTDKEILKLENYDSNLVDLYETVENGCQSDIELPEMIHCMREILFLIDERKYIFDDLVNTKKENEMYKKIILEQLIEKYKEGE